MNSVEKGGPADKGGIEDGDIILKFDGKTVNASADLPLYSWRHAPRQQSTAASMA
ncbi:MAG: PDZ domain-containing protein [Rhodocyclaceae bacterium]|nr:PDZ domain-containing protein [Rhodocyclaceae bacterium]